MTKSLSKLSIEGIRLNVIKAIYNKPSANITQREKTFSSSLRSGRRNDVPVATSIHCISGSLSQSNKVEKEIKAIQVRKEKVKLPVFEGVCVCLWCVVCVCVYTYSHF